MKGDGDIKKYYIKFLNVGIGKLYQVNVKIYDKNNCIIFDGTTFNGELFVKLKQNSIYKLVATFFNEKICTSFYTTCENKIILWFEHSIIPDVETVTFLLTDYYYNLPIEKGEIILWQK